MNVLFETRDDLSVEAIEQKIAFLTGDNIDVQTYAAVRDVLSDLAIKHTWNLAHALHHQHLSGPNGIKAQAFLFDLAEEMDRKLEPVWQAAAARRKA